MKAAAKHIALPDGDNITFFTGIAFDLEFSQTVPPARKRCQYLHWLIHYRRCRTLCDLCWRNHSIVSLSFFELFALDRCQDLLDDWSANENSPERFVVTSDPIRSNERKLQIGLEAFSLATKMVSVDADIKASYEILSTLFGAVCRLRQ